MSMPLGLSSLVEAEQDYAHFNARRTSSIPDSEGIVRAVHGPFHCVTDPTKSESPYYNRAVLLPSGNRITESDFSNLPESVRGVEIYDSQQAETASGDLVAAGFKPWLSLCYMGVELEKEGEVTHGVKLFSPDQTDEFFDLLELSGADFPKEKRILKQPFYCTDQFRCHVAFSENEEPAGWATSYLCQDGESVFLANAFTLPDFRRQGFHSALLQVRLNEVVALGRKRAFTDVEPGSPSYRNCDRLGFQVITNSVIWAREN